MALAACQLSTQEPIAAQAPLKLTVPTENCVAESLVTIEEYFHARADVPAIEKAFGCIEGAVKMLATYGRGTLNKDSFTQFELRGLMQEHFFGQLKLTDGLLFEVMRIKQALLGGSVEQVTRVELTRLISVLEVVRNETVVLFPYIKILNQTADPDSLSLSFLDQGISQFIASMNVLGQLMGKNEEPYRLESLKQLLLEIQNLYQGSSTWQGPEWFAKKMPLLASAKAVLVKPGGDSIEPDEWRSIFANVGQVYGLYLRFKYTIAERDFFSPTALAQVQVGLIEVFEILNSAIDAKGNGRIDYAIFNRFFDALIASNSFQFPIKDSTFRNLLPVFFEKIFGKAQSGGLTKPVVARIKTSALAWIEMHRAWDQVEKRALQLIPNWQGGPIPIEFVRDQWAEFVPTYVNTWLDLQSIFSNPLPPSIFSSGVLQLEPEEKIAFDRKSFTALNWKQMLIRLLGDGYVEDQVLYRMRGITLEQFHEVFIDFRDLAVDLGFLDADDDEIYKTGFLISNIFLFSADGDDRIGFHEAVDLFVFSFSATSISDKIHSQVELSCQKFDLDPNKPSTFQASCWRDELQKGYQSYFTEIPGWWRQVDGFDQENWKDFLDDIEKAVRKPFNKSPLLRKSEMGRAVSIHHYIESLFVRWDTDADDHMTLQEASKAFYLFKGVLQKASKFTDEEEIRALYFYLLTFGNKPEKFSEKVYWLWWKKHPEEWEKQVHATRAKVMQVFGNLAANL